jgi:L-ascorbate metabolism protein UlaG (beta-lactamase superfamily)
MRSLAVLLVTLAAPAPRLGAAPKRAPLELTYLGTAGWEIKSGDTVLLLDPYYSRLPYPKDDARIAPDEAAVARHAPARASLVMVSHSHWDHLLDAAVVAARTSAPLLGSASTAAYGRASGLPDDRIVPVRGGEDYAFDGFSVKVIPSLHSALYKKHWLDDGIIAPGVKLPMTAGDFKVGGTFAYLVRIAGREILFVSSANFIERELEGLHPDVLVAAPGLRQEIHDYTCRLLRATGKPRLVLATHFDEFTIPYDAARAQHDETVADQQGFLEEVRGCSPRSDVRIPRHLEAIEVPANRQRAMPNWRR